jgi:hypothetical protein
MLKHIVFADMVMTYSWTIEAENEEDAIAKVKKELDEGCLTLGDADVSCPTTDELFYWEAEEKNDASTE